MTPLLLAVVLATAPAPSSKVLDFDAVNSALDKPGPPQVEPIFDTKGRLGRPDMEAWFGPIGGFFPDRADRNSVHGAVVLQCAVSLAGKLSSCNTVIESPAGWGFRSATDAMIRENYLTTKPAPGAKGGDQARILIQFPNHHDW